ncbi:MAG: MMPL family transporter [Candidatus Aenigmatarchaeota archaeon]
MNYKLLLIVPAILILVALGSLALQLQDGGLKRDIELKGGTQLSLETGADAKSVEGLLKSYDATVRSASGLTGSLLLIDVPIEKNASEIVPLLEKNGYQIKSSSVQSVSPALGASFFNQAQLALGVAFVLMAIVIFIIFRKPLPSLYVVMSAAFDIIEALAFSQFIGIPLSLATFAALLLLVGYSVDTDILLTSRVLKGGEGKAADKIRGALKTGLTMSGTTIAAVAALLVATSSIVLTQIATVLLIGLVVDIVNTWFTNAILLRMYVERKEKAAVK